MINVTPRDPMVQSARPMAPPWCDCLTHLFLLFSIFRYMRL